MNQESTEKDMTDLEIFNEYKEDVIGGKDIFTIIGACVKPFGKFDKACFGLLFERRTTNLLPHLFGPSLLATKYYYLPAALGYFSTYIY